MKIILASTSPRRKEMLAWLGIDFDSVPPGVDEEKIRDKDPVKLAKMLAQAKAEAVAKNYSDGIVIGSDTVIEFEGTIIEKAANNDEQRKMIDSRKGKTFDVISGVCVINAKTGQKKTLAKKTTFYMANVPEAKIDAYIASGQGLDKGGGFGIQDENGLFIDRIEGCYSNCIGLPVCLVAEMLNDFGVEITLNPKSEVKKHTGHEC